MPEPFLLHSCCAPCAIAVIDELRNAYALTVFFYNPNIYPEDEYLRRKREVVRVCEEWGVPMIDADYEPDVWSMPSAAARTSRKEGCAAYPASACGSAGQRGKRHRAASLSSDQRSPWGGRSAPRS